MKEIKSREGYYLTQSAEVANEERTFITAIKGSNINENDWREATAEEKAQYEKTDIDGNNNPPDILSED